MSLFRRMTAAAATYLPSSGSLRSFSTNTKTLDERGFTDRLKHINVVHGAPKATMQEGDWSCAYPLNTRMETAVLDLMQKNGWNEKEVTREMGEFFVGRDYRQKSGSAGCVWTTVEDFQRTPWYRRFRPNDTAGTHYVSIELMKLLESALIPPSQRRDPYAHLRKRHYEDGFFNERYSEDTAKHTTRAALERVTPGMPGYGSISRSEFLKYDSKYNTQNKRYRGPHESYLSWMQSGQ